MAMNLNPNKEANITMSENLQSLETLDVDEYLFTPEGSITSRLVTKKENAGIRHIKNYLKTFSGYI